MATVAKLVYSHITKDAEVKDPPLFEHAASLERLRDERGAASHAGARVAAHEPPCRMVYWSKKGDAGYSVGQVLEAFDGLVAQDDDPFRYPIYYLRPRA